MKQLRLSRAIKPRIKKYVGIILASVFLIQPSMLMSAQTTPKKPTKALRPAQTYKQADQELATALEQVVQYPALPEADKELITSLPQVIDDFLNNDQATPEQAARDYATLYRTLTALTKNLSTLEKNAPQDMAKHIRIVRQAFDEALTVLGAVDPDETRASVQSSANFQILWRLKDLVVQVKALSESILSKVCVIESKLDDCCASIISKIDDILDPQEDEILSKVCVVESKLDDCCATVNSKLDVIDNTADTTRSKVCVIESKLDNCCATVNSKLDVIDTTADVTLSKVCVVESKLDDCCESIISKIDEIRDDINFSKILEIQSKLDVCCDTLQSKIEEILDEETLSKVAVVESKLDECCEAIQSRIEGILDDPIFSRVGIVESKLDNCCATVNSKLDVIDNTVDAIESKTDECCATVNSKLDVIDTTADLTLSQVDVVESKLDQCCATVNSKLDVIDETADTIASKVCDLHDCAGIPIFANGEITVTISTPGYYCLAANACGHLIIAANDVYVDLNNHTLYPTGGQNNIDINAGVSNVAIYNGSIVGICPAGGVNVDGITIGDGSSCINLHDLTIKNNTNNGINVGSTSNGIIIRNSSISQCGDTGILVNPDTVNVTVENVNIAGCDNSGIRFVESTELYVSHVNIQNVLGNAPHAAISLEGSALTAVNNVTLENVHVKNSTLGMYLAYATNVCVADSSIQQGFQGGIFAELETYNVSLRNVCIENIQQDGDSHGINVQQVANAWNVENVSVKDCSGVGILFDGTLGTLTNVTINNAYVSTCVAEGMRFIQCENATVKHSTLLGNGNQVDPSGGISFDTCSFCNFVENKVVNNFGDFAYGVRLDDCTECSVLENYIESNHTDNNFESIGLFIEGTSTSNSILNNTLTHNASDVFPLNSFGIKHDSNDASNKFFGNYACGHNDNYFNVDFIRDLENAGPYHNVECELVGVNIDDEILSKICVVESKLDDCCIILNSKIDANYMTLNSKLDALLDCLCSCTDCDCA